MSASKSQLYSLIDDMPDDLLALIISYAEFIKSKSPAPNISAEQSNNINLISLFDVLGEWEDSKDAGEIIREVEGSRSSLKADISL